MGFIFYNPNCKGNYTGDCVIRAISKIMRKNWKRIYLEIAAEGYQMCDMPSSNQVWGAFLRKNGFKRYVIPNACPDCYTVRDFCRDYPIGEYILATGDHVITVISGNYYDSWDSGDEIPMYFWTREEVIY